MAQRRHHYERAFEQFLRSLRLPYVAVDEARKALLPEGSSLRVRIDDAPADAKLPTTNAEGDSPSRSLTLKSFDFVIYSEPKNILLEVKGRRIIERSRRSHASALGLVPGRLENWVTRDDIDSMLAWQRLFGPEFEAVFLFLYWCDAQPPDALFQEVMEYRGLWYAMRCVKVNDYIQHMKVRSTRWKTMDLSAAVFEQISCPFTQTRIRPGMDREGSPIAEPMPLAHHIQDPQQV